MDSLGPVMQIILPFWAPVSRQISYFKDLSKNVEKLKKEMDELQDMRDEIQADVDDAISVGKRQKPLVENWLRDVRKIETQVDSIRLEFEQRGTILNGCCTDHFSRYKLSKRVVKNLKHIENLRGKGVFDMVAESPRRPRVLEMQTSLPREQQSTSEQTMEEIWKCLHDDENGVVCVYGMGGIGKTTIMKAINNRFIGTSDFEIVIWVSVSKDLNLGLIQKRIGKYLAIRFDDNEDIEENRDRLFARLKNVKYLLILDDLWEAFILDQVGIPKPDKHNRCKIVITTRFIKVCTAMGANKLIKVRTLTRGDASNLFYEKCGDVVLSSDIRLVVEKVVEECGGLPIAIKTVGQAMHCKDKKELWENALRALKGSSPEIPGMEREVFLPLKLSYDCLENDKIKACFLYCSLFPEDHDININDLVTYLAIEEGFIENVNNLEEASNKGHDILERIKDACLLEEGSKGNEYVRMHVVLRNLAIWITSSSSFIEGSKFLVQAGEGLVQPPEEKMSGGIERISLMCNKIEFLRIKPDCPNLVSLFLNDNCQLHTIHSSFFELMPKLQILDLSNTFIECLPVSLSQLVNLRVLILRSCRRLVKAPPLENLKELQLLDLSYSGFKNLPQGIASLVKLKRLNLSFSHLAIIPYNTIYGLTSLEDLSMLGVIHKDRTTFGKTANMTHLSSLRISMSHLNGFMASDMFHQWFSGLRRFNVQVGYERNEEVMCLSDKEICIRGCDNFACGIEGFIKLAITVRFQECKGLTSLSQLVGDSKSLRHLVVFGFSGLECIIDWRKVGDDALECLRELDLCNLPNLEKVFDGGAPPPNTRFQNLRRVQLQDCPNLRCLFSSSMVEHLHQLELLQVFDCPEMQEIIEGDMLPDNSFPRLCFLRLQNLSKLASIFSQRFIFISLEKIYVRSCPRLKKLPLFCSSIYEIKGEIKGEKEWWEGLEWEDENSKSLYSRIYQSPHSFI
ncbi:disease resistance protein RFL1-like [Magnolia sinica]|uniref:disease resistance protein RFL1-like n=1 Tax=Magnolia sinica TaxID=86752 RepID=UPI0026588DC5|nr:disease resistance protein RFL1-like [Magnolia sinica]XP_058094162.1 disease resistance protein RFL1-like [Magnolia sinica]XP_058094163.1 disease resistance protein RFL1-like [Magnolia sinica]